MRAFYIYIIIRYARAYNIIYSAWWCTWRERERAEKKTKTKKVAFVVPARPRRDLSVVFPRTKSKPNNKTNHRDFNWKGLPSIMYTVLCASRRDVIREASTSGRNLIIVNPCIICTHTHTHTPRAHTCTHIGDIA